MSKKKYERGATSIRRQIDEHTFVKLRKAQEEDNPELASYYLKEIGRLEEQLKSKQGKLLTRANRIRQKKSDAQR
ncbi:MAG: hypothetical protein A2Z88_08540 [Omnitrophica WOR_2 bacterium GWA2_47_8]|nr:MAG: hypothetical protein A2Z88_08540 [Omnitrophica WOR_2 bacterium GWA2_47_8]